MKINSINILALLLILFSGCHSNSNKVNEIPDAVATRVTLLQALCDDNIEKTKEILDSNPGIINEIAAPGQETFLFFCQSPKMLKLLIDHDANLYAENVSGKLAVFEFARDSKMINTALNYGKYNINHKQKHGTQLIHTVCSINANPQLLEYLLKNGANPNATSKRVSNPIFSAIYAFKNGGNAENAMIDLLLKYGAKVSSEEIKLINIKIARREKYINFTSSEAVKQKQLIFLDELKRLKIKLKKYYSAKQ